MLQCPGKSKTSATGICCVHRGAGVPNQAQKLEDQLPGLRKHFTALISSKATKHVTCFLSPRALGKKWTPQNYPGAVVFVSIHDPLPPQTRPSTCNCLGVYRD